MGVSLKVANLWRVIREVDLDAIRASARAPFDLLVVDEGEGNAARLRLLLSPDPRVPHPWIRTASADEVGAAAASQPGAAQMDVLPTLAVIVTRHAPMSPALQAAAHAMRRGRVPLVIVAIGHTRQPDRVDLAHERGVAVPALESDHARTIGSAIIDVAPDELRLSFAHQLPPLRKAVFDATVEETAKANASYSLTSGLAEVVPMLTIPLNLGDMVVLTKNQLVMSYRLVLASGRDGEPKKLIGEILGVLGGGLLFRTLARQAVGFIPVVGLVPKVAVAYGGTWAIGRAVVLWTTEGREVTADLVSSLSVEGLERGRAVAQKLVDQAKAGGSAAGARWTRLKAQVPLIGRRGRQG